VVIGGQTGHPAACFAPEITTCFFFGWWIIAALGGGVVDGGRNRVVPNLASLTTFSGLVVCIATIAIIYKHFLIGSLLFIMDGTGGTAIFWDRWSVRAGSQVHIDAIFSPVPPTSSEAAMLITHLPLVVIGLIILAVLNLRASQGLTPR
jgi:hypothetical protein